MTKLIKLIKSPKAEKKWRAVFQSESGRIKNVDFGAAGMEDYTQHHDVQRRALYRQRHKKDLATGDPTRPGFLAYYVLWGPSTSLEQNLRAYRQRFDL